MLLAFVSPQFRRTLAVIAVADGLLGHRRAEMDLDLLRFAVARRVDDAAYGAGVWLARSAASLRPRWITERTR